jgi:predicted transcriptional regulator
MGNLSDFLEGHIFGVHSTGASVSNMATLLGVCGAAVSKVMMAVHKSWEDVISLEE